MSVAESESAAPPTALDERVAAVRQFNRLYTRRIGVLRDNFLDSSFSLAEARVLYELTRRESATASEVAAELGLDHGYLSRILRGFSERGLIAKTTSAADRRQSLLSLTAKGRTAFAPIDQRSQDDVAAMLGKLSAPDQERVVAAMHTIERALGEAPALPVPFVLRPPRPGDMGWVVSRHGSLYAQEYNWNMEFEALVAEIVAAFIKNFDPACERCWIAEVDGAPVGSVFLVKQSDEVGKLRLLLVEPQARGMGIGARLVAECIRFARLSGYRTLTLWTNDVLVAARRIYQASGFCLVQEEKHHSFGHDLAGQNWELEL
jgi:DNA-binding MarR family transcriptional regulator/N-acetylglutamate synthase-like GNAT family acetyltransferase